MRRTIRSQVRNDASRSRGTVEDWNLPSVVLVDDDPLIADMYSLGLTRLEFVVKVYPNASALFAGLGIWVPDVLVLDWLLPDLTAVQILERLQVTKQMDGRPIFILSNYSPTDLAPVDRVSIARAVGWFEKTKTSPTSLAKKLSEALERLRM